MPTSIRPIWARLPVIDRSVDPQLVERFRSELISGKLKFDRLGAAVSGGPDSLALLLLAHAAFPGCIEAVTVDHGLRAESAREAQFVAQICEELGVPHSILRVNVESGNLQQEARESRYLALGKWHEGVSVDAVMTAHHADDQAETLLMRLNRESGLSGLASIRQFTQIPGWGGHLYRPLLGWRKAELEVIVRNAGLEPVRDPSNEDDSFDRARIRKSLAQAAWLDVDAIASSAGNLNDADLALDWMVEREWAEIARESGSEINLWPRDGAPRELLLRLIVRAIGKLGKKPRGGSAANLLNALQAGVGGNLAGVLVTVKNGVWTFRPEPPRKTA